MKTKQCEQCQGQGLINISAWYNDDMTRVKITCTRCNGTGNHKPYHEVLNDIEFKGSLMGSGQVRYKGHFVTSIPVDELQQFAFELDRLAQEAVKLADEKRRKEIEYRLYDEWQALLKAAELFNDDDEIQLQLVKLATKKYRILNQLVPNKYCQSCGEYKSDCECDKFEIPF